MQVLQSLLVVDFPAKSAGTGNPALATVRENLSKTGFFICWSFNHSWSWISRHNQPGQATPLSPHKTAHLSGYLITLAVDILGRGFPGKISRDRQPPLSPHKTAHLGGYLITLAIDILGRGFPGKVSWDRQPPLSPLI